MPADLPASTRVAWFKEHPPRTGMARLAYLDALAAVDPGELFVAEIRRTWREVELNPRSQADFLARRSEEHTSELQSLMRNSSAVFCLKKTTLIHPNIKR